jgi:hypothetical protein
MGSISRSVGSSLIFLLLPIASFSQNCEAVLGYVRDTAIHDTTITSRSSFKHFFCDQTYSSYQQVRDSGLTAGIPIDGLPVTFGGYDRSSSWSQYQRSICESVSTQTSLDASIHDVVVTANANVVKAWTTCINSPGLHFWAETNQGDASLVDLVAQYNGLQRDYEVTPSLLRITPVTALNCKSPTIEPRGFLNNQLSRVSCVRAGGVRLEAVNVTLPTSAGALSVKFTPVIPPVTPRVPTPPCTRLDGAGHCLACSFPVNMGGMERTTAATLSVSCPNMAPGLKEAIFDGTPIIENYTGQRYGLLLLWLAENTGRPDLQPDQLKIEGDFKPIRLQGTRKGSGANWTLVIERCDGVPAGAMTCAFESGATLSIHMAN